MSEFHTTSAGTKLPILSLKGKQYLEVKYRIVWFREDHPDWTIETDFLKLEQDFAIAKATIKNSLGIVISTSHKFENVAGFADFIEKAETGSIGRALALIGYGTQFCADEFDEGNRLVDSPGDPTGVAQKTPGAVVATTSARSAGDYQCTFGKKYKGLTISQIIEKDGQPAFQKYLNYFEEEATKNKKPLSYDVKNFVLTGRRYLSEIADSKGPGPVAFNPPPFHDEPWPTSEHQ